MGNLNNKVAVVTGASKGIGASIAKALGAAGASVVVNYASSKQGADRVVSEIVKNGGKAIAVQGDVSKPADVNRLFAETEKAFGHLDILVNNAAIYQFAPLGEITEEHFDSQFDVNVKGLLLATQEAVKHFNLDVHDGELMIIVGPSGSGKSTALRMVAGLEDISGGELKIGGQVVNRVTGRPFKQRVYFTATPESQAVPKVSF